MSQLALFRPLSEVSPASVWEQRWARGRQRWRHPHDGAAFDPKAYAVETLSEQAARAYIVANHYSGSYPAALRRYGLYCGGHLVGVAVLGVPTSGATLTNVFPELAPYRESAVLARFVLADEVAANGESWFLAQVFHEAAATGLRGLLTFADPVPRRIGGAVVFPGHVGTIYQATNAVFTGRSASRLLTLLPTGQVLNERAKSKVRRQERGHEAVERHLCALGATPPRAGQRGPDWLARALDEIGALRLRHGGNYRYAWAIGDQARRRHTVIATAALPYPKHVDT